MTVNMETFSYQNWKIENFSCWDVDFHPKCIRSPSLLSSFCYYMELYPRGVSGGENHLIVGFCETRSFPGGHLSFIGSDGSTICTVEVTGVGDEKVFFSPQGPKYEDVIEHIRKRSDDQLTVQFVPSNGKTSEQRMCTAVETFEIYLEIDPKVFESLKPNKSQDVYFGSHSQHERWALVYCYAARVKEEVQLALKVVDKINKFVSVMSSMKLLRNNGSIARVEKNKKNFQDGRVWIFSDSLRMEELVCKTNVLLMISFKIVKYDFTERYNSLSSCPEGVTLVQKTNHNSSEKQKLQQVY